MEVNQSLDTENRVNGIRTVKVSDQGKVATPTITPLMNNGKYTLVECVIESGRTHQIRVHAEFIGMPVLGDCLYGDGNKSLARKLFLHAKGLKFDGYAFEASLPIEFNSFF